MSACKTKKKRRLNRVKDVRKKMRWHIVLLGMIIVSVILYSVLCTIHLEMQGSEATEVYAKNYTQQRADMIYTEITNGQAAMLNMASSAEISKMTKKAKAYLERQKALFQLDFAVLYDADKKSVAAVGDIPEYVLLEGADAGKEVEKAVKKDECDIDIVDGNIIYTVNLYKNDTKSGVLYGGKSAQNIQNIITVKSFQERGSSYIVNGKYEVLLSAESGEHPLIWDEIISQTEDEELSNEVKVMMQSLKNGKSGVFKAVLSKNRTYYLSYSPTGISDWSSVTIVPVDLFTGFSESYMDKILGSLIVVLLVFSLLFFIMFKNYNDNEKKIKQLAFSDEITGGINRLEFRMKYEKLCSRHEADEYAIIFINTVDFKSVNKNFGIVCGDRTLRYFYSVIDESLKKEEGEFAARTEMDHFFVCMKEKSRQKIKERLEEIVRNINSYDKDGLSDYHFGFRIGVSFVDDMDAEITVVQDRARAALKNQGSDDEICVFYDSAVAERVQRERRMEQLFPASVVGKHFLIYMQPKVSLEKGKIKGAEALVRWDCPELGFLSPGEFIPVLENNGSIRILDRYVFEQVCIWIKKRMEQGKKQLPVSVNLSRNNFVYDDFLTEYVQIAEKYGVDKSLIELEVTETIFLDENHMTKVRRGIQKMHEYGFKCALDDFGVGFSSLTLLRTIDIDVLKMDRSFFGDLHSKKSRDVIGCIVDLADKLNISIVAEGIETAEQIAYMKLLRCDVIQGYYFSKPLPVDAFERWIENFEKEV